MMIEVLDHCGTNDEDHATKEQEEQQEDEEDNAQMDSGYMNESKENYHDSLDMDEEEGTVSYKHEYQKDEAVKQLSVVFQLLKIKPVHDKYVANLLLIF